MKANSARVTSYLDKVLSYKYLRKEKNDHEWSSNRIMWRLISTTDLKDALFMILGIVAALASGVLLPLSGLAFGSMSNAFVNEIKSTKSNSSEAIGSDPERNSEFMRQILKECNTMLCLGVISLVVNFLVPYTWDIVNIRQSYKIREVFFAQAMRQDPFWYEQKPENVDLTSRVTDDVEKFKFGFGSKIPILLQAFATLGAGFVVGFFENWKLTLLALIGSPLVLGSSIYHMNNVVKMIKHEQTSYAKANTVAIRALSSFQVVSSLGNRIGEMLDFNSAVSEGIKAYRWSVVSYSVAGSIAYGIVYLMYAAVVWYGGILMTAGELGSKELFSVIRCVIMGALGVGNVIVNITLISEAMGSTGNLLEIIDSSPVIDPYSRDGIIPSGVDGEVELKDIYFTYPMRNNIMVIRGLCLKVPKGGVVALVGSSGSGKSTIINLILRFYDPISGTVTFDGVDVKKMNVKALRSYIGVVSQDPALFNVSVEENIRYGRPDASFEEIENAAKLACAHDFIQFFPEGYQTLLGERGTKLSGGQKQRIAIARALLRDPKLLLLDEATSALDTESEAVVQASLENAMRGRTTIIVAHRLSTVKNADVIHVMSEGKIIESGKHDELLEAKGAYYELVHSQQILESHEEDNFHPTLPSQLKKEEFNTLLKVKNSLKEKPAGSFPMKLMISLCRPWLTGIGVISSILSSVATPVFSFLVSQVLVASALPTGQIQAAFDAISIQFLILGLAIGALKAITTSTLSIGTESAIGEIRTKMFHTFLSQEYEFMEEEDTSPLALTNVLARDPPRLKGVAGSRLGMTLTLTLTGILTVIMSFATFWQVALLLVAILPFVTLAGYKQFVISSKEFNREKISSLSSSRLASECFENIKTIQFLGLQEYALQKFAKNLEMEKFNESRVALYYAIAFTIASSCQYFALGASFLLGGKLISLGIGSTSNLFMAVTGVTVSMTTTTNCLAFLQDWAKCKDSLADVLNLLDLKKKLDPYDKTGKRPNLNGRIVFRDVWFGYKSKPFQFVLKGLNLEIEPGQTVALVGQSGCGKSTIINLLERFYTPSRGEITIDGVDIREINVDYLRKHIGLVTQEPTLFNSTIKENIVYGSEFWGRAISEEDVVKAAADANIHDFISLLPNGYDTKVGGRGCLLSGGQKQRVAIARALVRDPVLLLLDEATSALDTESEKVVQVAIENARKGRTSIVVTHRLSTIKNADVIVVLEDGQVAEKGTHDKLIELKGRYYKQLTQQR